MLEESATLPLRTSVDGLPVNGFLERSDFLEQIRTKIRSLDTSKLLCSWDPDKKWDQSTREHLQSLDIPARGNSPSQNLPSLLLHRLGERSDLKERAKRIIGRSRHASVVVIRTPSMISDAHVYRTFVNTAGSGKTRLVFEGLCHHWGLYFTCLPDTSELGAADVHFIIDQALEQTTGFQSNLSLSPDPKEALKENRNIAGARFNEVMLARLLILEAFIDVMKERGEDLQSPEMRKVWLLLQIFPSTLALKSTFMDVFSDLALRLAHACVPTSVRSKIRTLLTSCRQELYPDHEFTPPLFCVIDEAQHAADEHKSAFRNKSGGMGKKRRPVLREIVAAWNEPNEFIKPLHALRFIVTGTGINKTVVTEVVSSATGKTGRFDEITDTGAFDTQAIQDEYLRRYLPRSYADSDEGKEFLARAWYWLRGRYGDIFPNC